MDSQPGKIPHGIILDLMMPEMDSFEVLEKIRKEAQTRWVPVLVLTTKRLTEQELAHLKYNRIQQLVFKGAIDRKELVEKIKSMLRENSSLESSGKLRKYKVGGEKKNSPN